MQQVPRHSRTFFFMGALAAGAILGGPQAGAQPQAFMTSAPVTTAFPNDFGINVGDSLNATFIADLGTLTGIGTEDLEVDDPGELTFTIENLLFPGTASGGTRRARFEDGVFQGFFDYENATNVNPVGISLSTSTGFEFDRDDPDPLVFATGGGWNSPVPLASEN